MIVRSGPTVVGSEKPSVSSSRAALRSGSAAYARTAWKPWSASSAGISGCLAISGSSVVSTDSELVGQALGVVEHEAVLEADRLVPASGKALGPEVERLRAADPPDDPVDHPRARPSPRDARVLEERDVRAGIALLVGVEQVVDRGVVLVDRLLDQPQPEHAGVEVDVLLGVGGDRGDVVDALELHRWWSLPVDPARGADERPLLRGRLLRRRACCRHPRGTAGRRGWLPGPARRAAIA